MRDAVIAEAKPQPEQRGQTVTYADLESWAGAFMETEVDSGVKVNRKTAWYVPAVWQLGSMISGDLAKLPCDVYKRIDEDTREIDKYHACWYLLRHKPNDEEHAFYFKRDLFLSALFLGAGYAHISRNGRGEPEALTWLDPDQVTPERIGGRLWFNYETVRDGKPFKTAIANEDMFHLRGMSFDGSMGAKLVYFARHTIGLAIARQRFASKFFKNGAKMSGFVMHPPGVTPEYKKNVNKSVDEASEEKNWGKPFHLWDGNKWQPNMVDPRTGQMTEQGEAAVREICRYFNVAPSRAGLSDSVSYNSKSEDNQNYLDTTLSPWITAFEYEANTKLLSRRQQIADTHYFEHNVKALLRLNAIDQAQVHTMYLQNGVFNPNIVLRQMNLPPRPGGDEYKPIVQAQPAGGADKGGNSPPRGEGEGDSQLDRNVRSEVHEDNPNIDPQDRSERIKTVEETFKLANVAVKAARKGYQDYGKFVQSRLPKYKDIPLRRALADAENFPLDKLASEVERICDTHKTIVIGD